MPAGRGEEGRDLAAPSRTDGGPTRVGCKLGHSNIKRASISRVRHARFCLSRENAGIFIILYLKLPL